MAHMRQKLRLGLVGVIGIQLCLLQRFHGFLQFTIALLKLDRAFSHLLFEPLVGDKQFPVAGIDLCDKVFNL